MNPYIQEVVDRTADNTRRSYDTARLGARGDLAAAGGFGSTALGTAYGQIADQQERQIGDQTANLLAQGFDSSTQNALGLYNSDRAGNLSRASQYQNIGNNYQGLDQYGRQVRATGEDRMRDAGQQIQNQHQNELNAYYAERDRAMNYPYQQSDFYKGILQSYPTGSVTNSTQPGVGRMQGALGGGMLGYSASQQFGGGNGNSFFSDPYDVVPSSGYGPTQPQSWLGKLAF
jgi:hypothetical protein